MNSQLALPGQPPPPKESLSQYDTPAWIARRMALWAGLTPGTLVLEPSAGLGSIADAAMALGARVMCCELDPDRAAFLRQTHRHVFAQDFLTTDPREHSSFEIALMNPPFEENQDLDHVLHALKMAPRVVALLPLGTLDGVDRYNRLWLQHTLAGLAVLVRRFKAAGTEMSGQRPFAVFDILRGKQPVTPRIEHWI